jgi:anti-anti-sigma regulatory factor
MLASLFAGWFARPAEYAAPRAPRPSAAAVQVEVSRAADGMVIRVKGEARAECAGALLDGLLAPARRPAVVTLDLSELRSVSRLALGVLAAYRRSVVRTGGRVRLAGVLQPAVNESPVRAELFDLFETSAAGPSARAPEKV